MLKALAATALAALAVAQPAEALTCTVVELSPPAGAGLSAPYGINNSGVVVGTAVRADKGGWHATEWKGGEARQLELKGSPIFSWARAIDESGQIAGYLEGPVFQAVRWDADGKATLLENPTTQGTLATSINNRRTIVGYGREWSAGQGWAVRPIIWDHGKAGFLPTLDGASGLALSINDQDEVVGYSERPDGTFATIWTGGEVALLDHSGSSYAQAINNRGQIVGYSGTPGAYMAVLWNRSSSLVYLPSLYGESYANAINDRGQIVGSSGGRAVLWDGTMVVTDLNGCIDPNSGWLLMDATGINDTGAIIGTGSVRGGEMRAFKLMVE